MTGRDASEGFMETDPPCGFEQAIDADGTLRYFVDGGATLLPSWMTYVQCARHEQEQNLEMLHMDDKIFYRVIRVRNMP